MSSLLRGLFVVALSLAISGWTDEGKGNEPSKGETVILGTFAWDIETNMQGDSRGADVWWNQATPEERFLVPWNGAGLAMLGKKEFDTVTRDQLAHLKYSQTKLAGDALAPGTVVALRTNEGNFAKLKVVRYRESRDFSFPDANLLTAEMRALLLSRPNVMNYNLEVKWQLYRK